MTPYLMRSGFIQRKDRNASAEENGSDIFNTELSLDMQKNLSQDSG